ncbi:amino acid ABC transporter permease [Actinoallomurus purpureus]|uniref:amino acid ABC transporter permease n=1 Tax=Actinoallomurus purpureus TaxID=478114 RepID=UPI0020926F4A|nr:amino acid ABC transporter permease [Actinoallomurus purpureus]MCO6007684.1 amino acid ABC transporter permease [Actinoallomurus purpureus]
MAEANVTQIDTTEPTRPESIRAVPVRHPGRWVSGAVILVLTAMFVHMLFTNKQLDWSTFRHFFFDGGILKGLVATLELTVIAMAIGIVGGIVLALMRLSSNPLMSSAAWLYIWFFRGTPVLVQLIFWFNIKSLMGDVSLGVPFGPVFITWDVNSLVTTFVAAILGLGLNEAAYMSEIVRAGILSVDEGQTEASQALGMRRLQIMRRVVLPQAMRVIIPPTGNETISMLKTTSLASTVAFTELLKAGEDIFNANYKTIPLLIVVSVWYIIVTSVLSVGQYYLERHYGRGSSRALPPTPLQRLRRNLTTFHVKPPAVREGSA